MKRALAVFAAALLAVLLVPAPASAAPPFVDRTITLPRHSFAFDGGLGLGHVRAGNRSFFGPGLNLEGAFGITDEVELGFRTGLRLGDDGERTAADTYGRTFFLETYGTGGDPVANPEFHIRWAAYTGNVVEVGLDGRAFLPIEQGTRFGLMFGVPLAFHVGAMRIDTGAYLPILFYDQAISFLSVPGYFWFQTSERVWLGPIAELRLNLNRSRTDMLLGFGVGVQVADPVDLKSWILFPAVNQDDNFQFFGVGFGVQIRVE
jgi:hypothetical protein